MVQLYTFLALSVPVLKIIIFKLFIKNLCPYHDRSCNKIAIEQFSNSLTKLAG